MDTSADETAPPPSSQLGSHLLGRTSEGRRLERIRIQTLLTTFIVGANVIGVAVVVVLVAFVVPGVWLFDKEYRWINFVAVPVYIGTAFLVGIIWGTTKALKQLKWNRTGQAPTTKNQQAALAMPWRLAMIQASLWFGALIIFTTCYGLISARAIPKVAFTIAAGGIVVCAISYLLSEFALRPVAAKALAAGNPPRKRMAGVTARAMLSWILGTGVPIAGLMIIALFALIRKDVSVQALAVSVLALGGIVLCFGLLLSLLNALSTVAPIKLVRTAMARVEAGKLDTEVVVFDGTELGDLQVGFNRMAHGLRERKRLHDLFGRHVGRQVAEQAMAKNPELGGEERMVAVFFIDLIGSTAMTASRPPKEIVDLLNRFFAVIVEEVDKAGGFINKFEGDAALAIFGAPVELADPAGSALRAARLIMKRIHHSVPEVRAGVGVSYGRAVAANVGAHERFEYTVIGDPVNEAARLSDLSKEVPGHLVASGVAVSAADTEESNRWVVVRRVTLRGRPAATEVAVPVENAG